MALLALVSLCACNASSPYPHANLEPLDEPPGFAVVTSDYVSTAIALLNTEGDELITEAWIDSGTTPPGLTTTIGGDVVLASTPPPDGTLTLIDRLGVDVVTRIEVPTGNVLQQIHAQSTNAGETGFRANPHDWLRLNEGTGLISRHEPNRNPNATELDQGNDVISVDIPSGLITGRIDLSSLGETLDGTLIYARPTYLQPLNNTVAIGLARLSLDFRTAGKGALGLYNTLNHELTRVDFKDTANCGTIASMPGSLNELWVLCAGDTFSSTEQRRLRSGIIRVSLTSPGTAISTYQWLAKSHGNVLVPSTGLIPINHHLVVAVATGDALQKEKDQILVIDTDTNTTTVLFEADDSFILGQGCYAAEHNRMLIPDASVGIRRWSVTENLEFLPLPTIDTSPLRRLPAREIRPLVGTAAP